MSIGHICYLNLNDPTNATTNFVDISKYVRDFDISVGKQHDLDRIEAGTMSLTLNNLDRRFDPINTAGLYTPYLKPIQEVKFGFVINNVVYWQFDGFVDRWPQHPQHKYYSEIKLTATDGFDPLKNMPLISAYATLTTAQGGNKDITFTAQGAGYEANYLSIQYLQATGAGPSGTGWPLGIHVEGLNIVIYLGTNGSGSPNTTANTVIQAINNLSLNATASGLVSAKLAGGSNGSGIPSAAGPMFLSGGTFNQELSGSRINNALTAGGWSATRRRIDAGQSMVQAQDFPIDGSADTLTHCQDVADTELGWFFMDRNGNATFFDRRHFTTSPYSVSQMTLVQNSDIPSSQTTLPYMNLIADFDKDLLWNEWVVTRTNGQPQTYSDATSLGQYFHRQNTRSPLYTSDLESMMSAEYLTQTFKQPSLRFEPIQLRPGTDTNYWLALAQRDLGDRITIVWTPPGTGSPTPIFRDVVIANRHISGGPGPMSTVVFEYQLLPVWSFPSSNIWTLDDATLGKLDQNILIF